MLERPVAGLRSQFVKGMAWTTTETYGSTAITFVFTAALARVLDAHDFGLAAAASVLTLFFFLLIDALSSTIVQHREATREQISAVFWSCEMALIAIYVAVFLIAPFIAAYTHAPELSTILRVASLQLPILGLLLVPLATLRAELRFRELAFSQIAAAIVSGVAGIILALQGFGYWALIFQGLILIGVRASLILWRSGFRPMFRVSLRQARHLAAYSGGLVGFTAVNYWSRSFDILLVGRFFGAQGLGYYSLAFRLIGLPVQFVSGAIRPLLHPTFVAMTGDQQRIRTAYLRVVHATTWVTFPMAAVLWLGADDIVRLVWGPGWEPVGNILRGLSLFAAVQPVNSLSASVYMASGATGLLFKISSMSAVLLIGALLLGLPHGPAGLAWALSLTYAVVLAPISSGIAWTRLLGGSVSDFVRAILPGVTAGGALLGAILLIRAWIS